MNLKKAVLDLLMRHTMLVAVVTPGGCVGLADFPPAAPLRLNLSTDPRMTPPMRIEVTDTGLSFFASFRRVSRSVEVPWAALLFFGTEAALEQACKPPVAPAPKVEREGNVVKVDFGARARGGSK